MKVRNDCQPSRRLEEAKMKMREKSLIKPATAARYRASILWYRKFVIHKFKLKDEDSDVCFVKGGNLQISTECLKLLLCNLLEHEKECS